MRMSANCSFPDLWQSRHRPTSISTGELIAWFGISRSSASWLLFPYGPFTFARISLFQGLKGLRISWSRLGGGGGDYPTETVIDWDVDHIISNHTVCNSVTICSSGIALKYQMILPSYLVCSGLYMDGPEISPY